MVTIPLVLGEELLVGPAGTLSLPAVVTTESDSALDDVSAQSKVDDV